MVSGGDMDAIEFVKKFGWEEAIEVLKSIPLCAHAFNVVDGSIIYYQQVEDCWYWYNQPRKQYDFSSSKAMKYSLDDLKRLVESWELVESYGGVLRSKSYLNKNKDTGSEINLILASAVKLVEKCNASD